MGPISRLATRDGESHLNPTKSCRATITAMGLSMQTDQAITFAALQPGQVFRFHHRDKVAIGLKAQFAFGTCDHAAVVLKPTHDLPFGGLVGASEVGDAVLLGGAKILPSARPESVTAGKNNIAEPGEIELRGAGLHFITLPHGKSMGKVYRVNINSGAIALSGEAAPVEIYSCWSITRGDETIYEHRPAPKQSAA